MARWYIIHAYSGFENKVRDAIIAEAERLGLSEGVEEVEVPRLCAAILPSRGAFEASGLTDQRRARGPAVLPTSFRMASSAALAAALSTAGWFASESEDIDMVWGVEVW